MSRNARPARSHALACGRALALLICLACFSGCTAMSKYDAGADPAPFSATANNLGAVYLSTVGYQPERRTSFDFFLSPMAIPVWLGTLPVSAAWDLLTLPYDLVSSDLSESCQAHERRFERIRRLSGAEAPGEAAPHSSRSRPPVASTKASSRASRSSGRTSTESRTSAP